MSIVTILQVVESGLCTGCGTCVGVCPHDALTMKVDCSKGVYEPQLNPSACTECGLCYRCCPGSEVDFSALNSTIFGETLQDTRLGQYIKCYSGHASDEGIRFNSTSGGIVTALLTFALETGLIDGALVVGASEGNPLKPQPFIASTWEQIANASGSKYCPVPVNAGLDVISQVEGRYAVVGLPCQIHGIRKAEATIPALKRRIVLCLGIFCGGLPSFLATEFLLNNLYIDKAEIVRLEYRGRGWPGQMTIETRDHSKRMFPYPAYWSEFASYFFPHRCMFCTDAVAELSDISVGDAWLPQFKHDTQGESVIVSRSVRGEEILSVAVRAGVIELAELSAIKLAQSQASSLNFKQGSIGVRAHISKVLGKKVPNYGHPLPQSGFRAYICFLLSLLPVYMARHRALWKALRGYIWLLRQGVRLKRNMWLER